MQNGFTTGTAAAAASKAYVSFLLTGVKPNYTDVLMPDGSHIRINVSFTDSTAFVIKDSGSDPDVTHRAEIHAHAELTEDGLIRFKGGKGVGTVTKAGLQIPVGEPAINPVPRRMIEANIREITDKGVIVTIIVPDGERLAEMTFNSRLGITGGISIIGTTGIVHPMSVEALVDAFKCEIDVKLAEKKSIVLVPGKIGEKHLQVVRPDTDAVMVSNYFGEALSYLRSKGVDEVTLAGHPGKLAKLAMGYYNTHSNSSPQAQDFVSETLGIDAGFNTVEEICLAYPQEFSKIARKISDKIEADFGFKKTEVLLFNMKGDMIGSYAD